MAQCPCGCVIVVAEFAVPSEQEDTYDVFSLCVECVEFVIEVMEDVELIAEGVIY